MSGLDEKIRNIENDVAQLSIKVNALSNDVLELSSQIRVIAKRFNLSTALMQDHQAIVNRLTELELTLLTAQVPELLPRRP